MSLIQRYRDARQLAEISSKANLESQLRKRRFAPTPIWLITFAMVVYALFALSAYRGAHDASLTEAALVVFGPIMLGMSIVSVLFRRHLRDREHLAFSIHLLEEDERLVGTGKREDTVPLVSPPRMSPQLPAPALESPPREDPEVGGPCDRWIPNEQVPPKDKCH